MKRLRKRFEPSHWCIGVVIFDSKTTSLATRAATLLDSVFLMSLDR